MIGRRSDDRVDSPLFHPEPRDAVLKDLLARSRRRLDALPEAALVELLEDALFHERKRLERAKPDLGETERLDALARALVRGTRSDRLEVALDLVRLWGDEIHGKFDPRTYRFATRLMPGALTALLTGQARDRDPGRRLHVDGPLPLIRELCREGTVVLAPTHVSNLDSPLIGLALHLAGLPPFVYGAGLNLFENPVMGFFLRRLGAYTVDRKKQAQLYKDVLKDYSVRCMVTGHHSLFFPGGTRCRSGLVEPKLKKGLLGTGIVAWQERLVAGAPHPDVYVVPLTLSYQLVLEAQTLIEDHLAEAGKQRFIIDDDEFVQPRRLAAFARRVLDLDASVVARFGAPIDVLGNPVSADPAERREQSERRRRYVCDRDGNVEADPQRDHVYTDRLADALVRAWPTGVTVMSTHLVAWVAWRMLEEAGQSRDPFRLVRVPVAKRRFERAALIARLETALAGVREGVDRGDFHADVPASAEAVLQQALDRFAGYHRGKALADHGPDLLVEDPKLCFYYRNRLAHLELERRSS
jgi:glycerol-3-phosphate O-acyltransferase